MSFYRDEPERGGFLWHLLRVALWVLAIFGALCFVAIVRWLWAP